MSKVIVFRGSPKKNGTTAALLAEVIKGVKSKGAEVVEYDLNDKNLRGCQACNACKKEGANACVQNDYLKPVYADLKDADGVILGSPIYMGTVTAQAWILLDRLFPAMNPDFSPRYPGKKAGLVITHGAPDPAAFKPAVDGITAFFSNLGWQSVGNVIWAGAGGDAPENLKKQAFAIGEKLVK